MAIPTSPRTVVTTSGDPALSVFAPKPTIIPIGMGNTVLNITEVTNYVSQNTIVNQPGGGQDEVQVNVGGRFVGDAGMTYNATDDALTVDGNVSVGGTLFTDVLKYANGTNWSFTGTYTNSNVASYLPTYSGLVGGTLSTAAQPNITSVGELTHLRVSTNEIHIGYHSAWIGTQGLDAVAVGGQAGETNQGANAVAIGSMAGFTTQGSNAAAFGAYAGETTQGANSVSVGRASGRITQGEGATALGYGAGYSSQGANSIALGRGAGNSSQGANSVAVGSRAGRTNQAADSIVLNATGADFDAAVAGFHVKPVRNVSTSDVVFYNTTTGEMTYSALTGVSGFSGIDGASGVSGFSGIDGAAGVSGIDGAAGVSGFSGIDGSAGAPGVSGFSGIDGSAGAPGVSGFSGIDGAAGVSGFSGIDGAAGADGNDGASGVSGIDGASGVSGFSGIDGAEGLEGPAGASGVSGFSGVWVNTVTILENLGTASSNQGLRAMITNANLVATGNFGAVVTDGGSNVVPIYSDGTDWLIG